MKRTITALATAIAAALTFGIGTADAAPATSCPKGTIATKQDDGTVRCAKITIVDPSGDGFLSSERTAALTA